MRYRFETYELDTVTQELRQADASVALEPQVFALLEVLLANADRVVTKDELNERIWGGRVVSEAAVNSRIRSARQAIGDSGAEQRLIKTVRGRGFRFVGTVAQTAAVEQFLAAVPEPAPAELTAAPVGRQQQPAIAVVPLRLVSLDTRYEPLADSIAHEVIADLSRLHWLRVISGASTFQLRSDSQNVAQIAHLLGADYVLCGTLSLFGKRANVIVELTRAETGTVVWADNIETPVEELVELRSQLATRIANAIEQRIQAEEASIADTIATEDLNAWTLYFRGLRHVNRFNKHDNAIGAHLFEQAIGADPGFALAHAGLSFAHFQTAFVGYNEDLKRYEQLALRSADQAFELDPLDPVVNLMVGRAKYLSGDWEQSNPWFERCANLSPNNALAYYNQALVGVSSGETTQTQTLSDRALTLSPIDPLLYAFHAVRAMGHLANDEVEAAAYWGERAANAPRAHHLIDAIAAAGFAAAGDHEKAARRAQKVIERDRNFRVEKFFHSIPAHEALRRKLAAHFAELGFAA
ncbi:MAG: winged helix-turn-helix domain-containing protein [Pseudomonadota bacterium]